MSARLETPESRIVELRQYTLKPGRRDELIALFEREFVESQEEMGMSLIGTFRDERDPDRFVWLRGFPDMETRAKSLAAFYGGPVWKTHREAANATMLDSDNVLLLRPAWSGSGFANDGSRAPRGAVAQPDGIVLAAIYAFGAPPGDAFVAQFRDRMIAKSQGAGGISLATLVTEDSANNFPALPVREGENVLVQFVLFENAASARPIPLPADLVRSLSRPVEVLRLRPTARSRLHG